MAEINRFDTDAQYTHEYSNFPTQVMEKTDYRDVDDSVSEIVNNIKKARADGQYAEAALMIRRNINKLKNMFISAVDINTLVEEIRNTQIFALKKRKMIYIDASEPQAEFEGDVWIDIDNTVEDPLKNDDLVVERNKTAEDYEAEITDLRNTYAALEDERLDFESKNQEIARLSQEYEALRKVMESSSTELQEDYTALVNESAAHNTALAEALEANGVEVRKADDSYETNWNVLIDDIDEVRSGGSLVDVGTTIKSKYVPKGETWYAQKQLFTGSAEVYDTLIMSPTTKEEGQYTGGAGYYKGIKINCDGIYNTGYADGYAQGKETGMFKTQLIGSVSAGASNSVLDGEYTFELPPELHGLGLTVDNFYIVPTSLVVTGNSTHVYTEPDDLNSDEPLPTASNPYNKEISGVPFSKSLNGNTLKVTVNKITVGGQYDQALARAWVNADVYAIYMKK